MSGSKLSRTLAAWLVLQGASAHALIAICEVTVNGKRSTLSTPPSRTPYESKWVDYDNNYRFAMHLSPQRDLLKTSTYYMSKKRHVLIHQNTTPLAPDQCKLAPMISHVYSPELEREFSYTCQLTCDKE